MAIWVEVSDETEALMSLAARGLILGGGSHFAFYSVRSPMIRVATTQLPEDAALLRALAKSLDSAASGQSFEPAYH